jgi:DnaJ-class molecular chaperone
MNDPYVVLGVGSEAEEDEIRQRYLQLVRENPPERAPERFAEIRAAYDQLRDPEISWERRLFDLKDTDGLDALLARRAAEVAPIRYSTNLLLSLGEK